MKTIYKSIFTFAILLSFNIVSISQTLFIDDFNYPVRDSLEGIGGWYQSGVNSPYNVRIISPGLSYTGYVGSGIGNTVFMGNQPNGDIVLNNFATQTTGNLYMVFMFRAASMTATATQGYNIGFDQSGGATNLNTRLYVRRVSADTYNFGVNKMAGVSFSNTVYNTNTTYLVVLKYAFISGVDNDSSKMYIFTSGVPVSEPSSPDAFVVSGTDMVDQGEVFLSNSYAQSGLDNSSVRIDGIRIGRTWQSVIMTSVKIISNEVPDRYSLFQNYPNPFNPTTKIQFSIPAGTDRDLSVQMKIYDYSEVKLQHL